MKYLLMFLALSMMSASFAGEVRVVGAEAEKMFSELQGKYEYTASAIVTGLTIETVLRHDERRTCTKETVKYAEAEEEVAYSCSL